jgi:isoleucyl-tRNA synthetase
MQQKERQAFTEVDARQSLPDLERGLVATWAREGTFEQSLANRQGGPRFVF